MRFASTLFHKPFGCACCLLVALSGCCHPKGFILRGDWSLELNRLPFMSGHGGCYESDGACAPAVMDDYSGSVPAEASHGHARRASNGSPASSPRFHPVPTSPPFGPSDNHPRPSTANAKTAADDGRNGAPVLTSPMTSAPRKPAATLQAAYWQDADAPPQSWVFTGKGPAPKQADTRTSLRVVDLPAKSMAR